jgi:HD-GYP domain-containing protein (c-di-GMP phosphodiesterase class II)
MDQATTDTHAEPSAGGAARLVPIPVDSLDFGAHNLDLYIYHRGRGQPAVFRAAGVEFSREDLEELKGRAISFLHIPQTQYGAYRQALAGRLERLFSDPEECQRERARVVRAACTQMIEEVLLLPGQPEPIAVVSDLARQFGAWCDRDPGTFSYMLEMADHDFCTTTHMVNVGVGCGLLGARLRPGDSEFGTALYQGGLLHDVGKRGVPQEVLNKEGELSPEEWELVRKHPEAGYAELTRNEGVPAQVLEMTRDHHERLDGGGYPNGRSGEELSLATRICTVVDVFDALTAARPYRGSMPPADALQIMRAKVGTHFDEEVFAAWDDLVQELLRTDPSRLVPAAADGRTGSLDRSAARVRSAPKRYRGVPAPNAARAGAAARRAERRQFERHAASCSVQAEFVHQLRRYPMSVAQRFTIRVIDVSRSGIQVETPWSLTVKDELIVHVTTPSGPVSWRACVVRVRAHRGSWRAGLQLLQKLDAASPAA